MYHDDVAGDGLSTHPRAGVRRAAIALSIAAGIAVLEVAGAFTLDLFEQRHPLLFAFDLEDFLATVTTERLRAHADASATGANYAYDPVLGWIRTPGKSVERELGGRLTTDDNGSRVIPDATGPVWMATYGDSFTEGLEVDDAATWQAALARSTGTRVRNFGVSGYGPDQGLLYLELNLARGETAPVVVLAMINENRNRLVGYFPLFYTYPNLGMYMAFKPRFVRDGRDGWSLHTFMPEDMRDLEATRAAARAASRVDPFFTGRRERSAFPYSFAAASFLWRHGPDPWISWPGDSDDAWAIVSHLVDRLVELSRTHDFIPVLALLPQNIQEIEAGLGPHHRRLAETVTARGYPELIYIDVIEALSGPRASEIAPGFDPQTYLAITHPSAEGNAAIAAALADALTRAGAGPEIATSPD